ncbi:S1/P1 Nuclease [Phenylobacterium sp.]|uniref:S1/P1 Nuclease n=1 Tax=Phenylobacterium sp. TaxID=1871053 RepID=UPI00286BA9B2|nr:S1/P1 Nuclease [Phenylobacterium sp.]
MRRIAFLAAIATLAMTDPDPALAWGASGHRMIGEAALRALPADLPAFLRTPRAIVDLGELSREPDRWKGAGRLHDADHDPEHFVDLSDDGSILGGPRLAALPATRAAYDTAMRAVGQDEWKAGVLPYAIIDRYQQLTRDFAMWRALRFAERHPAWAAHRGWFTADRRRREAQLLVTLGELSHFVGDGSQPLHVSIHYNGWGDFPNPDGYTTARIHSLFESELVRRAVDAAGVALRMPPPRALGGTIEQRTADYLAATGALVIPLYQLEKAGGLKVGDPRGAAFATERLAAGAAELRDLIVLAWHASDTQTIGWRPIPLADVLSGETDPYVVLYGVD